MQKPKTIKGFLKMLISIADTCAGDMVDIDKISDEDAATFNSIIAGLQNDLGDADDLLNKYNLKWEG